MLYLRPINYSVKVSILIVCCIYIVACSGGSPGTETHTDTSKPLIENPIKFAFFRDQDGTRNKIGGSVTIDESIQLESTTEGVDSVWAYWVDTQGDKFEEAWLKTSASAPYRIDIPEGTSIPNNVQGFVLFAHTEAGLLSGGYLIKFHDFVGNTELSGPGGNEINHWYYGRDRQTISIERTNYQGGLCIFDNGLVSVTNMGNKGDEEWESRQVKTDENIADELKFPAYEFVCDADPVNTDHEISDDVGVWTYSTLNDAMFYGTVVYDSFQKYLGEPPLEEKLRLRVHYGHQYDTKVYWDGAYANFSDGYPFQYSMASLDSIAHEIGHGVLSRISALKAFKQDMSTDARTLHEAFSDIAGVMAKYEFLGTDDIWLHGEESKGGIRRLNQIVTEVGAIESLFDYDAAGENFYLRIGMITYPFYLLSNQWGLEAAYKVYINSARSCWSALTTLTEAAECIKQQAEVAGQNTADVVEAFKAVKIKLFDDGVLSHFNVDTYKLRAEFTDNSMSSDQVRQWYWIFGDGESSTEQNPVHTFTQLGEYEVSLTVTDQSGDRDVFYREVSVTDQYCAINQSANVENHITNVAFSGTDLNYNHAQWDYTETPIELVNADEVHLSVEGSNTKTSRSTTWLVWVDLNDNGIFGDEDNELILRDTVAEGEAYMFNTSLDFSNLPNDGKPKYMRVIGDYAAITACSSGIGEAFDLRVLW